MRRDVCVHFGTSMGGHLLNSLHEGDLRGAPQSSADDYPERNSCVTARGITSVNLLVKENTTGLVVEVSCCRKPCLAIDVDLVRRKVRTVQLHDAVVVRKSSIGVSGKVDDSRQYDK